MARKRFAFVLWLWTEAAGQPPEPELYLRGSLELVEPKRIYYFSSLDELPQLIRGITGWPHLPYSGQTGEEVEM